MRCRRTDTQYQAVGNKVKWWHRCVPRICFTLYFFCVLFRVSKWIRYVIHYLSQLTDWFSFILILDALLGFYLVVFFPQIFSVLRFVHIGEIRTLLNVPCLLCGRGACRGCVVYKRREPLGVILLDRSLTAHPSTLTLSDVYQLIFHFILHQNPIILFLIELDKSGLTINILSNFNQTKPWNDSSAKYREILYL